MGIFTNTTNNICDVPECKGYSFEVCGHYDALTESLEDSLSITEAMHAFGMAEIEGLGRIKARIPAIHGSNPQQSSYLETKFLPWATPAILNGGTNDMGQFIIPIKGSTVVMSFELDSATKPIYFGTIPTMIGDVKQYNDNSNIYNGENYNIDTNDRITDLEDDSAKQVIYKSFKGSTIMIDDKDGKESISIIDAAGQQIILENDSTKALPRRGNNLKPKSSAKIKIITAGTIDVVCDEFNVSSINKETGTSKNDLLNIKSDNGNVTTTINSNITNINGNQTNLNSNNPGSYVMFLRAKKSTITETKYYGHWSPSAIRTAC